MSALYKNGDKVIFHESEEEWGDDAYKGVGIVWNVSSGGTGVVGYDINVLQILTVTDEAIPDEEIFDGKYFILETEITGVIADELL